MEAAIGRRPTSLAPLAGGCIAQVYRAEMAEGEPVVVKARSEGHPPLSLEGAMLGYLAERTMLPVPRVLACDDSLLVMEHVPSRAPASAAERAKAEEHAADLLADLHAVGADAYGFGSGTLIGSLPQPNPWTTSWAEFFAEQRLRPMARAAAEAGRLGAHSVLSVERVADRAADLLGPSQPPGLIHGDVWSGNVLYRGGQIAAFLDPAIYYADPEVELAFITLFGCFGGRFFERYAERRSIRAGFFELRRHVYNLYPLLVHVRLFGGSYAGELEATLERIGA